MSGSRVIVLPTCSICRDDNAGLDMSVTTCGHAFHTGCIRAWDDRQVSIGAETKCPSCNNIIRSRGWGTNFQAFCKLHSLSEREITDQPVLDRTDEMRLHLQKRLDAVGGHLKAEMADCWTKACTELHEELELELHRWERDTGSHSRFMENKKLSDEVAELRNNLQEIRQDHRLTKDEADRLYKECLMQHNLPEPHRLTR
ncbi:hypothetical protein PtB15_16B84 [Puccinia triticina]|nr:hypothetical protein PtB15_16B84 [Puccinia triticina]